MLLVNWCDLLHVSGPQQLSLAEDIDFVHLVQKTQLYFFLLKSSWLWCLWYSLLEADHSSRMQNCLHRDHFWGICQCKIFFSMPLACGYANRRWRRKNTDTLLSLIYTTLHKVCSSPARVDFSRGPYCDSYSKKMNKTVLIFFAMPKKDGSVILVILVG